MNSWIPSSTVIPPSSVLCSLLIHGYFKKKVRKGREDEEMSKVVIRYLCQEGSTWYSCIVLNTKYKYTVKYKEGVTTLTHDSRLATHDSLTTACGGTYRYNNNNNAS